jgi:hypothetical protein
MTVRAFAGLTASTHPAATSTALSFDFMAVTPLWTDRRSRHQHRSYKVPRQSAFFGQPMVMARKSGAAICAFNEYAPQDTGCRGNFFLSSLSNSSHAWKA